MSLTKSLTKSNTSSLLSTTQGVNYADALPDGATLEAYYPLRNDLLDRVTGSSATLVRASGVTYPKSGELVTVATNLPAVSGTSTLVQGAITNKYLYSEQFNNSAWVKLKTGVTANQATAPDGTLTAESIIPITATGLNWLRQLNQSVTIGVDYTVSIFAQENGYEWMQFIPATGFNTAGFINVNVVTGETGYSNLLTAKVSAFDSEGFRRISVTDTATSTQPVNGHFQISILDSDINSRAPSQTLDGVSGMYYWGAMFNEGNCPASYVKSEGTAGVQAVSDLEVDSSSLSVNDCAIYGVISGIILNTGSDQDIFETAVDGSNGVRLFNPSGTNDLTFRQEVATVNSDSTVTPTSTTEFEFLIQKDSVGGTIFEVTGDSDTQASYTADLEVGSTMQMMNNLALSAAANGYEAEFKYISKPVGTTITLAQARIAV